VGGGGAAATPHTVNIIWRRGAAEPAGRQGQAATCMPARRSATRDGLSSDGLLHAGRWRAADATDGLLGATACMCSLDTRCKMLITVDTRCRYTMHPRGLCAAHPSCAHPYAWSSISKSFGENCPTQWCYWSAVVVESAGGPRAQHLHDTTDSLTSVTRSTSSRLLSSARGLWPCIVEAICSSASDRTDARAYARTHPNSESPLTRVPHRHWGVEITG
jgi:hypothetical protein